jgi:hypothetical protein
MRDELLPYQPKSMEKRRIRFDGVAKGADTPRAESRSFLGLFRLWGGKPIPERRRSPRHKVVESQVWLGWWRGAAGYQTHGAVIIDLSRGGAYIFLDLQPPRDQPVWVSLGMPDLVGCVEARVVSTKMSRQGQCAVRLEFLEPCPYGFFEAAVCGMAPTDPRRRSRRPAEGDPSPKS